MRVTMLVGSLVSVLERFGLSTAEFSNMSSKTRGRGCWSFVILLLALLQRTHAYVTVSMNGLCKQSGFKSLGLSSSSATALRLLLDTSGSFTSSCKMEIVAPEMHSISLLYTRRKKSTERKMSEGLFSGNHRPSQCLLTVSFPIIKSNDEVKLSLDLCSEDAFSSPDIEILPSRVILEWLPMVKSVDEILASEIVIAALGKGRKICSQPGQLFCNPKYPLYCISKDLVCDGKRNCPEGSDEEKELCSPGGNLEKSIMGKSTSDTTHIGQDWEVVASEVLKKLIANDQRHLRKSDVTSTTERSMVIWSDDNSSEADEPESLPDVLKHYGPWGYLMLGMLICGTVLMFCGLWECCCRKPKSSSSSQAGPTLLIINQGVQQSDADTPQTPGPPRYEDLDQPPSYAALFPSSKALDAQTTILPITIPIVDSLSNLLTSSSQSAIPENVGHSSSGQTPDVFTIGIRRDAASEPNPK